MPDIRALLAAGAVALGGCSLVPQQAAPLDMAARCEIYLQTLDAAVARHEAGDAGAWRLPGFPHLRSNRFLATFRQLPLDETQTREWLSRLRTLDAEARAVELANLSPATREALLAQAPFLSGHSEAIGRCGELLLARDAAEPRRLASIRARSKVPNHYSNWQRVLGLYPLTQWFARRGVSSLHEDLAAEFALPLDQLPVRGTLRRYVPATAAHLQTAEIAGLLQQAQRNPLAIPEPQGAALASLLNHFAPVWEFEQRTDDDRIGQIRFHDETRAHYVDVDTPVAYRWISHTRFNGEALLQLNYLVWMPARTAQSTTDIYAGAFDGLIWRVTLLPDGTPLAFDSVHPCGCYYLLFNGAHTTARTTSNIAEPVLVAQQLPALQPGQRMVIRVRAADHYIQRVYPDADTRGVAYQLLDNQHLLTVRDADGKAHSLFDDAGLLRASARPERYLLWPFGISSAGAMRRSGTHAIAFVGVRHFDDAYLLDELVELNTP